MLLVSGVYSYSNYFLGREKHESPHDVILFLSYLFPLHDLEQLVRTQDF